MNLHRIRYSLLAACISLCVVSLLGLFTTPTAPLFTRPAQHAEICHACNPNTWDVIGGLIKQGD